MLHEEIFLLFVLNLLPNKTRWIIPGFIMPQYLEMIPSRNIEDKHYSFFSMYLINQDSLNNRGENDAKAV